MKFSLISCLEVINAYSFIIDVMEKVWLTIQVEQDLVLLFFHVELANL